jgi:hypothetical protein
MLYIMRIVTKPEYRSLAILASVTILNSRGTKLSFVLVNNLYSIGPENNLELVFTNFLL